MIAAGTIRADHARQRHGPSGPWSSHILSRVHRHLRASATFATLAVSGALLAAQNPRDLQTRGPETFTTRTLAANLDNPWEVTWGPDGWLWVTERTAFRVTRINPADGTRRVALVIDDVYQSVVQDGLMGMALHPGLLTQSNRDYVYVSYTYDRDPGPGLDRRLRIRRYTYDAGAKVLRAPIDILANLPAHDDHGGARIVIGADGKLYLSRGDNGSNWLSNYCNRIRSQDLPSAGEIAAGDWSNYQGKILRLNLDGSIPTDNPVYQGVRSHIYAVGLRNVQGLAVGPSGVLYASDHGPTTDDELNVITAGRNYGWPHVAGFKDDRAYTYMNWSASAPTPCSSLKFDRVVAPDVVPHAKESAWEDPAFQPPIATFFTVPVGYDVASSGAATIAPAGIDVYTSSAIPGWADSVLVTGLRTGGVYRVKLAAAGRAADGPTLEYFRTANRYRDLALHPNGTRFYLATDNFGTTMHPEGGSTSRLTAPGTVIEFAYTGTRP